MRDAYVRYIERDHRDAGKPESTLREYRSAITQAELFCEAFYGPQLRVFGAGGVVGSANHRSWTPMVQAVCRDWLRDFREWLRDDRKLAAITVNKRVATISAVVAACHREEIVDRVPRLVKLPCEKANRKLALTVAEVDAIYRACRSVEWPSRSELSVVRWKTAVVLWATYGPRCQDLVSHESCKPGLTWGAVRVSPVCPEDESVSWDHGWLRFRQSKTGGLVCVPITEEAARHLRLLRSAGDDPASRVIDFPLAPKAFYGQWQEIRSAAARAAQSDRVASADVHNFRDTATTWHNRITPRIAPYFTGHSQAGVSEVHYHLPYGSLCDHLRRCAWPESFRDALPVDLTTRQLRLF